jgi:hypothetical protein
MAPLRNSRTILTRANALNCRTRSLKCHYRSSSRRNRSRHCRRKERYLAQFQKINSDLDPKPIRTLWRTAGCVCSAPANLQQRRQKPPSPWRARRILQGGVAIDRCLRVTKRQATQNGSQHSKTSSPFLNVSNQQRRKRRERGRTPTPFKRGLITANAVRGPAD